MVSNLLFAVGVILLVCALLALVDVLAASWVTLLVLGIVCLAVAALLSGRVGRSRL